MPKLIPLLRAIQRNLTDDLLTPEWRRKKSQFPLTAPEGFGHCYVASEALYWLWGRQNGWKPAVLRDRCGTHWYLRKGRMNLDPTSTQWSGQRIPYEKGRGCGFLTLGPSKRCRVLIKRLVMKGVA